MFFIQQRKKPESLAYFEKIALVAIFVWPRDDHSNFSEKNITAGFSQCK